MQFAWITLLIVVSIVWTIFKARKVKREKEEREKRDAERRRTILNPTPPPTKKPTPPHSGSKPENPFPEFDANAVAPKIADPFESVLKSGDGSLSPAQYNEWLLDFKIAEKEGVSRPVKSGKLSPFARYLAKTSELGYLYKLSGFTPQNSLSRLPVDEKLKPQNPTCLLKNEKHVPSSLEAKFTIPPEKIKYKALSFEIYPKNPNNSDIFVSFYKDKN